MGEKKEKKEKREKKEKKEKNKKEKKKKGSDDSDDEKKEKKERKDKKDKKEKKEKKEKKKKDEPTQKKADTERMTKDDMMMVAGEITTQAKLDYDKILCGFVTQIGIDSSEDDLSSVDSKY